MPDGSVKAIAVLSGSSWAKGECFPRRHPLARGDVVVNNSRERRTNVHAVHFTVHVGLRFVHLNRETLAVVEAVKLEAPVVSPVAGTVGSLDRDDFSNVDGGDRIVAITD